jgi:hypothetical protein
MSFDVKNRVSGLSPKAKRENFKLRPKNCMEHPFTPPTLGKHEFHCPHCRVFATQGWQHPHIQPNFKHGKEGIGQIHAFQINVCGHCRQLCVWFGERLVYPLASSAPHPNPDIPVDIQNDFNEAREILGLSPRGAAALLRLVVQKLCKYLGESGTNINDDVASLVKKGLPEMIQQSLDIVRVVGNNAVHPGQIDLEDNPLVANQLFDLVNVIAEIMISQPNRVSHLYSNIVPASLQAAIAKRDGRST